jgi:alcohol dehydrogenase (NADP+)
MYSARPTLTPTASRLRVSTRPGNIADKLYVFPIPDALASEAAASMLCAGLTTDSGLVSGGDGPGKKVAAIGIGGLVGPLPHTGPHVLTALRSALGRHRIIFGNALGAEFIAFSRHESKLADAKKLGAADAVHAVGDNIGEPYSLEFDLIISTADVTKKSPLEAYMKCVSRRLSRSAPFLSSRLLPHRARSFALVDRR